MFKVWVGVGDGTAIAISGENVNTLKNYQKL